MSKRLLSLLLIMCFVLSIPCQAFSVNTAMLSNNNVQEVVVQQKEATNVASTSATQGTTMIHPGSSIYAKLTDACPSGLYHRYTSSEHPWARGKWARGSLGYRAYMKTSDGVKYGFVTCGHGFEYNADGKVYSGSYSGGPETHIGNIVKNGILLYPDSEYLVDYTFVELLPGYDISDYTVAGYKLTGMGTPEDGMEIYKEGSNTKRTKATVGDEDYSNPLNGYSKTFIYMFRTVASQIVFAAHRDSGGVVYSSDGKVLGVLTADSTMDDGRSYSMITRSDYILEDGGAYVASGENPITLTVSEDTSTGSINLSWNSIPNVSGYNIYRRIGSGTFCNVGYTTGTTFCLPAGNNGDVHEYFVLSNGDEFTATASYIAYHKCKSVAGNKTPIWTDCTGYTETGTVYLKWEHVVGAVKYQVLRSGTEDADCEVFQTVYENSFVDRSTVLGHTYYYKIRAVFRDGSTTESIREDAKRRCPMPITTASIDEATGKPKLEWEAVSSATEYMVGYKEIADDEAPYIFSEYVYGTSYIFADIPVGSTYYYVVRAVDDKGFNSFTKYHELKCSLAMPVISVENDIVTGKPKISWQPVDGATYYWVYSSDTIDGEYKGLTYTYGEPYIDESVSVGTTKYYKVIACNYNNQSSEMSQADSRRCMYPQPVLTVTTDPETGKPKFSWEKVTDDNVTYFVCYDTDKDDNVWGTVAYTNTDSCVWNEGKDGVGYYFKMKVLSDAGSAYSETVYYVCGLTQPQVTPSNVASTGKPKLSWTKDSSVEKYYVLRSDSENGDYTSIAEIIPDEVKGDVIEYTDDLAVTKKTYYYKIQAEAYGTSVYSTPVKITTKYAQPQNFKVEIGDESGKPKLSWDRVAQAGIYQYCYSTDGVNYSEPIKVVGTEVVHTDAQYGTTYYYKVQAINNNSSAMSSAYSEVKTIKLLRQPENVDAVIDDETKKTTISWDEVEGADYYIIYLSPLEHTAYSELGRSTTTTYENNSHYIGEIYYKVKACSNDSGTSALSESKEVIYKLSKPVIKVTTDVSTGKPKISWDRDWAVSHYYVYKVDKTTGEYTIITVVSCNNNRKSYAVVDTTAKVGEIYEYTIKACHGDNKKLNSDCADLVSYQTRCAKPVVTASIDGASGKPKLSWNTVNGANSYYIYRSNIKGSSGKYIGSTGATDCIDYSAQPGETYYYTVKAIVTKNSSVSSLLSSPAMCKCDEIGTIRMNISYNRGTNKPLLIWKNVTGASEYTVYRSNKEDGEFEAIANNSSDKLTYIDDDVMPGRRYYYKVEATTRRNADEYVIATTDVKDYTRKIVAPLVTVSKDEATGKPQLSWNEVYGATHYYVYCLNTVSKKYEQLAATGDTTYTHKTAEQGETYSYKVVAAVDAQVEQDYDSLVEAAVSIDETISSCNLSWQEVENATHYYVYYSLDEGETYKVLTVTEETSYVTSKTQADMIYKVEARYSIDTAVCSELSEVVSITI